MELRYIVDNDDSVFKTIQGLGFDLDSIFLICKELLELESALKLENGDLRDFVYRLCNRYNHLNGINSDLKLRCEDSSPYRITYQPPGLNLLFFTRCPGQYNIGFKEALYYCEECGPKSKFMKKNIKVHLNQYHKGSLNEKPE